VAFTLALIGCGVIAYVVDDHPAMPDDVCIARSDDGPRYSELLADERITIAVVFGELAGGPDDYNARSASALAGALRARGFRETAPSHFEARAVTIDIAIHPNDKTVIGPALTAAFATHELVYYNGHSYEGDLDFAIPDDYRIAVLDTCWSTQLYSARVVGPSRDVIGNTDRSVTGSIDSLITIVDGLRAHAPAWQPLIERSNAHAVTRALGRAPFSRYTAPEHYRLDSTRHGKSAGQRVAL